MIVEKFLHFYYVEGKIGWNLRRRNSWIPRSRANALESPAELGFHLGDQGENDRQNQMLSVAPHTSVLVIASKIIVRRRISVLPTYLKNLISSKNISSSQFFSNFFLKKVTFTNFCKKYVRLNFHTMNISVRPIREKVVSADTEYSADNNLINGPNWG